MPPFSDWSQQTMKSTTKKSEWALWSSSRAVVVWLEDIWAHLSVTRLGSRGSSSWPSYCTPPHVHWSGGVHWWRTTTSPWALGSYLDSNNSSLTHARWWDEPERSVNASVWWLNEGMFQVSVPNRWNMVLTRSHWTTIVQRIMSGIDLPGGYQVRSRRSTRTFTISKRRTYLRNQLSSPKSKEVHADRWNVKSIHLVLNDVPQLRGSKYSSSTMNIWWQTMKWMIIRSIMTSWKMTNSVQTSM